MIPLRLFFPMSIHLSLAIRKKNKKKDTVPASSHNICVLPVLSPKFYCCTRSTKFLYTFLLLPNKILNRMAIQKKC